ncbi:MAG: RNA polymerase sigma factor [Gemmataceae bacterium]
MSLLARLRSKSDDAWHRLVLVFSPVVYGWATRAGLQDSDAADLSQEVFAAVYGQIDRFEKTETSGTFRGWLYGITRNQILLRFRKLGREPRAEGGSTALDRLHQSPDATAVAHELPETLQGSDAKETEVTITHRCSELVRGEFEARTWAAFEAVVVGGRKPADVAADIGLSVGAVYVAKSRVLKRLREELDGLI